MLHYNEIGQDFLFSSMYGRLKKLQKMCPSKYKNIIGRIPYTKGFDHWKPRVKKNVHLASIFGRRIPKKGKCRVKFRVQSIKYKGGGDELLQFRRNGQQHLPDSSVVLQRQKVAPPGQGSKAANAMVELYGPEDSVHMFSIAVPNLLVDFQMAMSDEREVETLGWLEPSRGRCLR